MTIHAAVPSRIQNEVPLCAFHERMNTHIFKKNLFGPLSSPTARANCCAACTQRLFDGQKESDFTRKPRAPTGKIPKTRSHMFHVEHPIRFKTTAWAQSARFACHRQGRDPGFDESPQTMLQHACGCGFASEPL